MFDDGLSRAAAIPFSHNVPGFPEGIRGVDLLSRMRDHALRYGAKIARTSVTGVSRTGSRFLVSAQGRQIEARAVMMATGVTDRRPRMSIALHDTAVSEGLLRYCPICDGYEISDQKIAVIGAGSHAYSEALFLRSFTKDLSLVSQEADFDLSQREIASLEKLGIQLVAGPMIDITLSTKSIRIAGAGGCSTTTPPIQPLAATTVPGSRRWLAPSLPLMAASRLTSITDLRFQVYTLQVTLSRA